MLHSTEFRCVIWQSCPVCEEVCAKSLKFVTLVRTQVLNSSAADSAVRILLPDAQLHRGSFYDSSFSTSSIHRLLVPASEPVHGLPDHSELHSETHGHMLLCFFPAHSSPLAQGAFCSWVCGWPVLVRPLHQGHYQPSSEETVMPDLTVLCLCVGGEGNFGVQRSLASIYFH